MAKKKNQRKQSGRQESRAEDSDDFETSSTCSTNTSSDAGVTAVEEVIDENTVLEVCIDGMYEKRSSTRENSLRGLIGAFTARVMVEFVENRQETLLQVFLSSVRKGGASEMSLAARALGLLALTEGASESSEHFLDEVAPHLLKVVKQSSSPNARISALDALGIICFVGGQEEPTEKVMDVFWQVGTCKGGASNHQKLGFGAPCPPLQASALSGWSLLLSTLVPRKIASDYLERALPVLSALLNNENLAIRTAAGEAIALLYETTSSLNRDDSSDSDGSFVDGPVVDLGSANGVSEAKQGSTEKQFAIKQVAVVEQMRALSVQGSKHQSKRERAAQRTSFRELLATVEDGVCAETKLKLRHGDVLTINTWIQTIQLNALRRFLAEGFQRHLQDNELLHQIFDYSPRTELPMRRSTVEKRLYMSPNSIVSKARTQHRNRLRVTSQEGNEGYFRYAAEDI
eukprot:TRINITY_DN4791_c0_g1_i3.p1 TRINITY_DN4791_c0_g1~~TRINITY_DN4791_c0_g1_i3.p1  ORF type:complete len:459 (+),score=80.70 TRINITY_DN4791_c0_g1_i3:709-2085(+)